MRTTKCSLISAGLAAVVAVYSAWACAAAGPNGFAKATPEEAGLSASRLARIDRVMEKHFAEGRMIGGFGLIARHGKVAYWESWGLRDREAGLPMTNDTIVRMFSMSKPITTVAAMILHEQGSFRLDDPVSKFIPDLGGLSVLVENEDGGGKTSGDKVPAERDMTIRDLMRHTSGLTYGFFGDSTVDKMYAQAGVIHTKNLAELAKTLGELPLKHQPGTRWNYSYSTDMLGRVVEVISGKPLDVFFRERIFQPLKMDDTGFYVPARSHGRLSGLYTPDDNGVLQLATPERVKAAGRRVRDFTKPMSFLSGGGGLVSTAADYFRFAQMLLNGGHYGGATILSEESIQLMTKNQLEGISEERIFGLGFETDAEGRYGWGGAAGTRFWVDPERDMVTIFATQLYPGGGERKARFRNEFLDLSYQSLVR